MVFKYFKIFNAAPWCTDFGAWAYLATALTAFETSGLVSFATYYLAKRPVTLFVLLEFF